MNTQLNQEQIDAVVEWMMYFNIGSPTYHQFRKDFAPKDATKEAEHQKNVERRKQILKEVASFFNSPFMGKLEWVNKEEFSRFLESEIKTGDRVKLKGDSNSPEMTVLHNAGEQSSLQNTDEKAIEYWSNFLVCGYFIEGEMKTCNFHKDALQKLTPTQPSNKQ